MGDAVHPSGDVGCVEQGAGARPLRHGTRHGDPLSRLAGRSLKDVERIHANSGPTGTPAPAPAWRSAGSSTEERRAAGGVLRTGDAVEGGTLRPAPNGNEPG